MIDCELPAAEIVDGKIEIPIAVSGASCFGSVCVQVASTPIVANHSQDVRGAAFSDCLPSSDFEIIGDKLFIPAQYKSVYKVRVSPSGETSDQTCFFDTRVQPISGTGTSCSRVLGSVADSETVCDSVYPEARSLMNPRIAQILQPFHENRFCASVTCASGTIVDLCGCDASGDGVILESLDARDPSVEYIDNSRSARPPGDLVDLDECAVDNVIFFDPPSGGSVTLDAPGDDFVLPPYPVTLVVRGADLRIADNLIYPPNSNASLGVILLETDICGESYGGDALLHPDPTNIVGAYYLEGSVKTTDQNWNLPTDRSDTRWYKILKNQLLWEGTIISLNSIGGAVDPIWPRGECYSSDKPAGISEGWVDPPWDEAVKYDLAYLREYFRCGNLTSALHNYGASNWKISYCDSALDEIVFDEEAGEESAKGANAGEAVVLRYDSRIQNNPPPGFDKITEALQKELGL